MHCWPYLALALTTAFHPHSFLEPRLYPPSVRLEWAGGFRVISTFLQTEPLAVGLRTLHQLKRTSAWLNISWQLLKTAFDSN